MLNIIFKTVFFVGLVVGGTVRSIYGKRYQKDVAVAAKSEGGLMMFLLSLWGVAQILGLIYVFTGWLNFANFRLSPWPKWILGVVGTVLFVAANWLLWRSHADLDRHWSPTLEIQEDHALVTSGVYKHIRHPMYAAHWLWAGGQALLLHNWIAGLSGLIAIAPVYLARVPREEQMMLDNFGDEYREYITRTGRVLPRI